MIIELEGSKRAIEQAVGLLDMMPIDFKPLYFACDEGVIDKTNDKCADINRYEKFRNENPLGFMLYAEGCKLDITFSEHGNSSLFIEVTRKRAFKNAAGVLRTLSKVEPVFGYACMWEERLKRNGTYKEFGNSTLEWWVGRDTRMYIPGVYWLTLIPTSTLAKFNVPEKSLNEVAIRVEKLESNHYVLIQSYEDVECWEQYSKKIESFSKGQEGIFSKFGIQHQLDEITDKKAYEEFLSSWP